MYVIILQRQKKIFQLMARSYNTSKTNIFIMLCFILNYVMIHYIAYIKTNGEGPRGYGVL